MKHDWQVVKFVPPSGERNAYYGRKCKKCGVKTYRFGRLHRWVYPDKRVHDLKTVEEPDCV